MKYIIAFLLLSIGTAQAASAKGEISANVVSAASISQNDDGSVTTSGDQPLYCEQDLTTIMCYY